MEEITLAQLLASREERWHRQMMLIRDFPSLTLVCLTVIMPGKVKRSDRSLAVAKAAVMAMREAFGDKMRQMDERDLATGYEAYMLVALPVEEAKLKACRIEETHPLGRLFDIDVIDRSATPVSRSIVGLSPRRCLLCGNDARYCIRNHTHTQEELLGRIRQMIDDYVQRL